MANPTTISGTRNINLMDAVAISIATIISRQLLGRITGNNNLIGAGVKIGGSVLLNQMKAGQIGSYISAGLLIDGATDLANMLLSLIGLNGKRAENQKREVYIL